MRLCCHPGPPPSGPRSRIGQTAGFTGPVAAGVKETTDGAKLYIDAVNAHGGVNGQKIELVSLDDKFDPKLAAENAQQADRRDAACCALFLTRGTPHTQAIMPLLDEYEVPLMAPSTGAMVLHKPVQPLALQRARHLPARSRTAVQHLSLHRHHRIAVVQSTTASAPTCRRRPEGFATAAKPRRLLHGEVQPRQARLRADRAAW